MKIEKISDNQIRCTLTKEDLASRQIRLTELVYGNEKTRALFQDMMRQAYFECGFEVTGSPLMIEAIPMSAESIILIITRVDNPDELDSRFSRFSPEDESSSSSEGGLQSLSDVLDFFSRLTQSKKGGENASVPTVPGQEGLDTVAEALEMHAQQNAGQKETSGDDASAADQAASEEMLYSLSRFFLFRDLEAVIRAARAAEHFDGVSSLYKNPEDSNFYLILQKADAPADQFNRVCNVLTEYALSVDYMTGIEQLFAEHMSVILHGQALGDLRSL